MSRTVRSDIYFFAIHKWAGKSVSRIFYDDEDDDNDDGDGDGDDDDGDYDDDDDDKDDDGDDDDEKESSKKVQNEKLISCFLKVALKLGLVLC